MTLRLAFMGTPDFAVPSLSEILASGYDVVRVYTQPPQRAGRGKQKAQKSCPSIRRDYGCARRNAGEFSQIKSNRRTGSAQDRCGLCCCLWTDITATGPRCTAFGMPQPAWFEIAKMAWGCSCATGDYGGRSRHGRSNYANGERA